jgi:hypothetical protein
LKAEFEFLSDDVYFDRFSLIKSIDNTFVKTEIQTDLKLTGVDHDYLLRERLAGSDKEIGTLTHQCNDQTFEKDVFISHNEGTFDLKRCVTTKKLNIGNPLDCLIGVNKVNIFDYPAGITTTVQGEIEYRNYNEVVIATIEIDDNGSYDYSLANLLSKISPIPIYTSEAFYEFNKAIFVIEGPTVETRQIIVAVRYIRNLSTIKYTSDWLDYSTGVYYLAYPIINWNAPKYNYDVPTSGGGQWVYASHSAGNGWNVLKQNISNTVNLNDVLLGLFTCTGLDLVSNFLGINPDGSEPTNKYYDFSNSYCKDIKIVQSFDIIRESSLEDSFGKSGFLTSKEILTDISLFFNMMIVPDTNLGIVRWEHVSYFQTKGYDLTNRTDIDVSPMESNKDLIDSELFLMAQPTSDDFYKIKIKYNVPDLYKEENEKKYQVKKFLTDVFTTLNNAKFEGSEYESLFYLLSTDGNNIISLNNQFSINSIFRNLHDINRPYKAGQVADNYISFSGFSIGLECEIKFLSGLITWDQLYPLMSAKTKFGTFKIESVEANEKGLITLKCKK